MELQVRIQPTCQIELIKIKTITMNGMDPWRFVKKLGAKLQYFL